MIACPINPHFALQQAMASILQLSMHEETFTHPPETINDFTFNFEVNSDVSPCSNPHKCPLDIRARGAAPAGAGRELVARTFVLNEYMCVKTSSVHRCNPTSRHA